MDVTKGIPYSSESVEFIYSSHMIEHISRWQALELLRECMRTLVPGGMIRVATPDLHELASSYLSEETISAPSSGAAADRFMEAINPRTEVEANLVRRFIWRNFSGAQHQWMYDARSLCGLFESAGFSGPRVTEFRDSAMPDLVALEDRPESLFVEAIK